MEIVIKIPEEDYAILLSHADVIRKRKRKTLEEAVINGTPLPKEHGRLIDADALQMEMEKDVRKAMSFVDLKDFVWLAPTIIEAEGSDSE